MAKDQLYDQFSRIGKALASPARLELLDGAVAWGLFPLFFAAAVLTAISGRIARGFAHGCDGKLVTRRNRIRTMGVERGITPDRAPAPP